MNIVNLRKLIAGRSSVNSNQAIHVVVDPYSGALQTIETDHLHIHAGRSFQLSGQIASLGASGTEDMFIFPPAGGSIHFRDYRISADDAPVLIELYESPTVAVTGTLLTPQNRNRLSSSVSSTSFFDVGSASSTGTLLDNVRIEGDGTGANRNGEIDNIAVEWILDGDKTYLMRITDEATGPIKIAYRFFWYELGL